MLVKLYVYTLFCRKRCFVNFLKFFNVRLLNQIDDESFKYSKEHSAEKKY